MRSRMSAKFVAEHVFILVFSFVALAGAFYSLAEQYATARAGQRLQQLAVGLSQQIRVLHGTAGQSSEAMAVMSAIELADGTSIAVADSEGRVVAVTSRFAPLLGASVDTESLRSLRAGKALTGAPLLFLSEGQTTVAQPIFAQGRFEGAVILRQLSGTQALVRDLMRIFMIASYGVLAVALLVTYISTLRITGPIKNMSLAARRFGQGQFDQRVTVTGDNEMAELAMAFNNMADSLAKNEETRRSFIANLSHDLKTPMTTIAGFVDGILDGTIPAEQQEHYLVLVSDEVLRLSRLISTLTDLAKFETDEVQLKMGPFDLCETVRQVLISFEKRIGDRSLNLDLALSDEAIMARGDADAVHRVVYNIVDNAIKFTPVRGELSILVEERDKVASCTVRNSGDGIAPEDLPRLFDRFFKTDRSRSLDRRGSGLGLYIAKTIIDRHGGTIKADSVEGEYAAITFTLPLHTARSASSKSKTGREDREIEEEP